MYISEGISVCVCVCVCIYMCISYFCKEILDTIHYQIKNSWHNPIQCVLITKSLVRNQKFFIELLK